MNFSGPGFDLENISPDPIRLRFGSGYDLKLRCTSKHDFLNDLCMTVRCTLLLRLYSLGIGKLFSFIHTVVLDPDPWDTIVFGPPGSGSAIIRTDPDPSVDKHNN